MDSPIVSSLMIYPLKSAQGISVEEMPIVSSGPQYDREWMLMKTNGQFVSQRTHPQLSQVKTSMNNSHLTLSADGLEDLAIPLERSHGEEAEAIIFGKPTAVEKVGAVADSWFEELFQQKLHLVRSPEAPSRFTSGNNGPINEILFADGYPLLLANNETLNALNERLQAPVKMDRFRPNIVIDRASADEEEKWSSFNIGDVSFLSVKACARCSIINVDQKTGHSSKEVTKTLKSYRTKNGEVIFGRNLTHQTKGTLRVGQKLTKIEGLVV